MQRPTGGRRCARHCHMQDARKLSLTRVKNKKEAGAAGGAAVNRQINSQTDQSPPQYIHANGLRPLLGLLESNWEQCGNHFLCVLKLPMQQQTNRGTHLHIQGYQASLSRLIIFFPSPPAPLTLSFLSSLSFVNQGHPKPLPPLLYGPPRRRRGSSCEFFGFLLTDEFGALGRVSFWQAEAHVLLWPPDQGT